MTKPSLTGRNFPTAQQDATKDAAKSLARYEGAESSYKLAFTDTAFLLREEMRPVRMQLELLKPELVQDEQGIESTIVIFGSARIVPPDVAQRLVADASSAGDEAALAIAAAASGHVALLRRGAALRRARDREVETARDADLRRHRRGPRHHGGRQPWRFRCGRQEHRPEHRAAARAGAQPVHHAGAVLPVPLLRPAQDALPDALGRTRLLPRRLRHARTRCSRRSR